VDFFPPIAMLAMLMGIPEDLKAEGNPNPAEENIT
jgi:hypothetical protein